jgi:hypothetical protein
VRGSVTKSWLPTCAALYAAAIACSTPSPDLPPLEATGTPGFICQTGAGCTENGSYCFFAGGGQGCNYLECVENSLRCPVDASLSLDAAAGAVDGATETGRADAAGDAPADSPVDAESGPPHD